MTHTLKVGDRIRITANIVVPGYQPGDKGTVLAGPIVRRGREPFYVVKMDKGGAHTTNTTFRPDEIEPDV